MQEHCRRVHVPNKEVLGSWVVLGKYMIIKYGPLGIADGSRRMHEV